MAMALLLASAGCASVQPPQRDHLDSADTQLAQCAHWFKALDSAVARNDVTDIAARRMAGFPYLRIDRFLAAMKEDAKIDARTRQAWIEEMRARDSDGRRVEIANLADAQIDALAAGSRAELVAYTQSLRRAPANG